MTIKVGINGYGRIGRNMLRALYESGKNSAIEIVAVNDLGDANSNAHLTRRDTAHGRFPGTVDGRWRLHGRQWRSDSSSCRTRSGQAAVGGTRCRDGVRIDRLFHDAARPRASISKPVRRRSSFRHQAAKDVDATIVYGVNHKVLKSTDTDHFQCILHDQLPRAAGQATARQDRCRTRHHDDDSCLHQRPGV